MVGNGVTRSLGWTLVDENIENVERVKIDRETQRELGCLVGEHVFLEYPWAFVHRDVVAKHARLPDSPLAGFRERIEAYEADTLLVGYSSARLISDDFVICLTEEAKRQILRRNKNISDVILGKAVGKVIKTAKPWKSFGGGSEVEETFVRNTRQFFEIEIVLPGKFLGSSRTLSDRNTNGSRDSYTELVNVDEKFENVVKKCICRSVQTCMQPRETFVQTYPGYPRNAWTQYAYEDCLNEPVVDEDSEGGGRSNEELERSDDDQSQGKETALSKEDDEKSPEKTPLQLFLEARSQEMIDTIQYNAAMNLHVDDIENLSRSGRGIEASSKAVTFREQVSLVDFNFTTGKSVSDVSFHHQFTEYIAIAYVTASNSMSRNESPNLGEFQARVLLWRLNDPLRPRVALQDHREVYSVCFFNDRLVIGGCSTGQVVVWNAREYLCNDRNGKRVKPGSGSVLRPIIVSDKHRSHCLPVRKIRWIPAKYRIEPNGKLTKSSASCSVQFLTVSEDGTVAVWNLSPDFDFLSWDGELFQPMLRLTIRSPDERSRNVSPLCLCLPSINFLRECDETLGGASKLDSRKEDYLRSLWIGCAEGLIKCRWEERSVEVKSAETVDCEVLSCSYVHDGPVTGITRSPHLEDILLTVGGQVFAVWNDGYMDSPLFRRKTFSRYTACCWANEPGVFLLGSQDGSLEMWDIKNEPNQPIFSQLVSSKSIAHLALFESSVFDIGGSRMIGVGDGDGVFRGFREPEIVRGEDIVERMDWFEEYAWRELRRKKVFANWQNDFLANDPAAIAKRSARRDEARRREAEDARERYRREQEARLRSKAVKRMRGAPVPKDVAWKSKEFDRMRGTLLDKKRLVPSEIEAKRLPLVVYKTERNAKLEKARDTIARRDLYFSNALRVQFPELFETNSEVERSERPMEIERSINDYLEKFAEVRRRANEALGNNCP
ncbi:dynein axonemal intermediate chain 3 [Xylocopa sonorina]|uniref:dynein axonemal intermediate chain 3 n=1 Tax=Xylocopa sonorina TaxID=1818115 RepID=UPI00403B0808